MHIHFKDGSVLTLSDSTRVCMRFQNASGDHVSNGAPIGYECVGVVVSTSTDDKPTPIARFLRLQNPRGSYEFKEEGGTRYSLKMKDPSSDRRVLYGSILRIFASDNRPTLPASRDSGLMRAVDPFATTVPGEPTGADEPQ